VRPVYAPALVAFVGGHGGFGVNVSVSGPIGWFPLGFHDVYIPSYRVSRNYFTRVNVSNTVINTTVINNYYGDYSRGNVDFARIHYGNRNIAGAVTAIPAAAFVGARPVAGAAIAVNRNTFANARVSGFAALAPTRASLARPVAARAVPTAAVINRPIVAATRPPARVASFEQRQAVLEKNPGRPLSEHQLRNPAVAERAAAGAAAARPIATRPNVRVVTEHGAPTRTAAPVLPARAAATSAVQPDRTTREAVRPVAPAERVTPTVNRSLPAVQRTAPAATATEQPKRLDSSRFAHPQGSTVRETQPARTVAPEREIERSTPASQSLRNTDRGNSGDNARVTRNLGNRSATPVQPQQEYRTPQRSVQEYHAPVQQPRQEYQAPQRSVQEYRAPAQQPRQEYHAPVQQPRQEYHAPVQTQVRTPQRSAQPVERAKPAERKSDDKNDHGHHN
jgi:hypothetical protein